MRPSVAENQRRALPFAPAVTRTCRKVLLPLRNGYLDGIRSSNKCDSTRCHLSVADAGVYSTITPTSVFPKVRTPCWICTAASADGVIEQDSSDNVTGVYVRSMPTTLKYPGISPHHYPCAPLDGIHFSMATNCANDLRMGQRRSCLSPPRTHLRLIDDLPIEILQMCMDLLPTFGERARLNMACKTAARSLEWRSAPPLQAFEDMSGLRLGDLGARATTGALATPHHPCIGELSLANNGIGDLGACAIAALLKANCTIRRLSLRDNTIGDAGAYKLAAALAVNMGLEELDIWGNNITSAGKAALLASAKCKVFLEHNEPAKSWILAKLANGRVRKQLFQWISQLVSAKSTTFSDDVDPQDLLFRTFNLIDAFCARKRVWQHDLPLVGAACFLAATNMTMSTGSEESRQSNEDLAAWLAQITSFTVDDVRETVQRITEVLGFQMHTPTIYTFLRRYLRNVGWTSQTFSLANYIIEVAVMDTDCFKYSPEAIAAAATVLSKQYPLLRKHDQQVHPCWQHRLVQCSCLDVATELAPCAAGLSRLHAAEHRRTWGVVNQKYAYHGLHMVSKVKPNPPKDAAHFAACLSSRV